MPFNFARKLDVQRDLAKALDKDLERISEYAEGRIKEHTPVVTGRLKNSMEARKFKFLEHGVATGVKYAPHVEYGTSRFAGRKMMRKGIKDAEKKATSLLKHVYNI